MKAKNEALDFLIGVFGAAPDDLWVLLWTLPGKASRWFRAADLGAAAEYAAAAEGNVYVGAALSPKNFGKTKRCEAEAAAGIVGLWADVDVAHAVHKKPNLPPTADDARALFGGMGLPPTVVVDSGHGLQPWWLLKEPWVFADDADRARAARLAERWGGQLRRRAQKRGWDVDSTHDLARVLRLPGTMNHKETPSLPVRIVEADWARRYEPSDFEAVLPEVEDLRSAAAAGVTVGRIIIDPEAVPPFRKMEMLMSVDTRFKATWERRRKDMQDQSASAYDMALANATAAVDWTDQEITNLIVYARVKYGDKLKTDRKPPEKYYEDVIRKARESVARQRAGEVINEVLQEAEKAAGPNGPTPDDVRTRLTETVSRLICTDVVRFVRHPAEEPLFRMVTPDDSFVLGTAAVVLNQNSFRAKVAGHTKHVVPKIKERWESVAQAIFRACVEEDLGEEATESGAGVSWLRDYLADNQPSEDRDEAAEAKKPFVEDGAFFFFEPDLRRWLTIHRNERISSRALGVILRACGCRPEIKSVKIDSKWTTRYIWRFTAGNQDNPPSYCTGHESPNGAQKK